MVMVRWCDGPTRLGLGTSSRSTYIVRTVLLLTSNRPKTDFWLDAFPINKRVYSPPGITWKCPIKALWDSNSGQLWKFMKVMVISKSKDINPSNTLDCWALVYCLTKSGVEKPKSKTTTAESPPHTVSPKKHGKPRRRNRTSGLTVPTSPPPKVTFSVDVSFAHVFNFSKM